METTPTPEDQITPEKWRAMKIEAQKYLERVTSKKKECSGKSLHHILTTLSAPLSFVALVDFEDLDDKNILEYFNKANDAISYISKYFRLLEEFPDFRDKEENSDDGYSGAGSSSTGSIPELQGLVDEYERRLRGTTTSE